MNFTAFYPLLSSPVGCRLQQQTESESGRYNMSTTGCGNLQNTPANTDIG